MNTVDFTDDAARAGLRRIAEQYDDMTLAKQDIAELLRVSTRDRMLAGSSPVGPPCAPRSRATPERVRRQG